MQINQLAFNYICSFFLVFYCLISLLLGFHLGLSDVNQFSDPDWFSMEIHHGGRFYRLGSGSRQYKGGEVVYVDRLDPDKISWPDLNIYAEDLGYREPPIMYWFLLPGSIQGEGWLPICEDKDVLDMLKFMPSNRILQIYIVGGGVRKKKEAELEDEGGGSPKEVDHQKYIGNVVEDLEEVIDGDLAVTTLHGAKVSSKASGKRNKGGRPKNKKDVVTHLTNQFINVKASETIAGDNLVAENRKRPRMKQKACKMKKKSRPYETRFMGEKSFAEVEGIQEEPETSDNDDPNFEDLVDSDYDLDDNDDEFLFKANIDGDPDASHEFNEMGFAGDISDGEGEDSEKFDSGTDSTATEDEEERIQSGQRKKKKRWSKWREFQKEDMKNPQFELGMSFPNSDVFKDAVRVFSVKTKKLLTFKTNDRKRVEVVCITSEGCPFRIWASVNGKVSPTFYIKTINMEHKCSELTGKNYHCNAPFIAKGYIDSFMVDKNWSREGIQAAVQRDYGMTPGYQMCYRAKKRAARIAEGTVEDQYNLLESYAAVLKKTNPNTSVWIEGDVEGENVRRFKRIYICFGAMKKGWMEGCRPIIGVDGCHLKTVHKGQLLTAVGIDGNNGMYPIAWAVVEKETREAWTWFFKFLKDDLCLVNDYSYVFMSDKQKGILEAVKELFPNASHRHCARHLYNNFKGDGNVGQELKDLFWAAARSTTKNHWIKNLDSIHSKSTKAWNFLKDKPAEHWSRSHFKVEPKCDILLNNHCESYNSKILPARKMPILGLLEDMRINSMIRHANRRCAGPRWKSKVGPRIEKNLKKNADRSHEYTPLESSHLRFQVQGKGVACQSGVNSLHDVDLQARSCTCRRWELSGLPCPHAIAAIFSKGYRLDDFVDESFSLKNYMLAYEPAINPIPGVDEWEVVERPILPPRYTRGPGRPKLSRNKEPGEQAPPPGTTKLSRSYHQSITCSVCKKDGHNKRTCSRRQQQGNDSQAGVQPSETDDQSVHVEQAENVQSDVQVESDMHYGSVQQTANVPTPSIVASASSQPMISSPPLPQSSLQPTVIGSSHTSRTFVCPKTGMPLKTKSIAHKPKPKLVIGTSTKARAQQGPKEGSNKKIWKP